jgi:hypothetical protein
MLDLQRYMDGGFCVTSTLSHDPPVARNIVGSAPRQTAPRGSTSVVLRSVSHWVTPQSMIVSMLLFRDIYGNQYGLQ